MYEIEERDEQVELIVEDIDEEALFTELLLGLTNIFTDAVGGEPASLEVRVGPAGKLELVTYWVEQLISLTEEQGFVPERVEKERLEGDTYYAQIGGVRGIEPDEIRRLLLHDVQLKTMDDGAVAARVILDVE